MRVYVCMYACMHVVNKYVVNELIKWLPFFAVFIIYSAKEKN